VNASRIRIVTASAVAAAAAATAFVLTTRHEESVAANQTAAAARCERTLLADWSDGRIDRSYPIACYRAALRSLPTDLQVYSSAPDDIAQALSQRILQSSGKRTSARTLTR
jgi:hypothetical protein